MTICYECQKPCVEVSPRSRCVQCEHRRAIFNENEAEMWQWKYNVAMSVVSDIKELEKLRGELKRQIKESFEAGVRNGRGYE